MASQNNLEKFNKIYDETYNEVLKFIIFKINNIFDANDLIQETYLEFYKILNKKELEEKNIKAFIISIANNKIKKYYHFNKKLNIFNFPKNDELELIDNIKDETNIELDTITDDECKNIWKNIKKYKNKDVSKIFFMYFYYDMSLKEIANVLNKSESYIKNCLYRTINNLRKENINE